VRVSEDSLRYSHNFMSTAATPKTRRASALPPEERRSAIVAATVPLLLEFGDRVTSRQIAEAAEIAEGTIFRAFADKDEIITAVIEAALDPAPLEAALRNIPAGLPFERSLVAAVVLIQQRVIDVWRLMSSVGTRFHELARRPMVDSDALVRLFAAHRHEITVEPIRAARFLRALILSATHPMLAGEPGSPEELVHLFLHGVGSGPSC
jgi:AcrR family transcriptional regulator